MRTTSFGRNIALETDPVAVRHTMKLIRERYPDCRIETVTDMDRQLRGIDYIAHTKSGPINIDVKVRYNCERYWTSGFGQDIAIEYRQHESVGWGCNRSLDTDFILWSFPFGDKKQYRRNGWLQGIWLPHDFVCDFVESERENCRKNRGWNGHAYSYFIIPTMGQIRDYFEKR